jgi:outer membrane protein assembly factor BamD (BamD/ComL family)
MSRTRLIVLALVTVGTLHTSVLDAQDVAGQLSAGYAEWAADHLDRAAAIFDAAARQLPRSPLSPVAFVAEAKVRLAQGRPGDAVRAYDALLIAFPGYHLPANCVETAAFTNVDMNKGANVCLGSVAIAERAAAVRGQIKALDRSDRVQADPDATPLEKAQALYDVGRQWERTDAVDPSFATFELEIVVPVRARNAYEAAITAAPGSRPAGYAAWRLIELGAPRDGYEGDWEGAADGWLGEFGDFLEKYPHHPLAGEAIFNTALARWIKAGYPEVMGYLQEGADLDVSRARIETWFDTSGFGGLVPRTARHPEATGTALKMFRSVAINYPNTKSAASARYYAAVLLDWCLDDKKAAIAEYRRLVARYPNAAPFADKARARIKSLL